MGGADPPARPHELSLSFRYSDATRARTIERSLRQEVGEIDDDRSRTDLRRGRDELEMTVEAADLVALRAAGNTWLSLVSVAEAAAGIASRRA
ncbi:MAG: KEOPS complex subunit Pcc1 [Halobacteriales archaeon]